MAQRWDRAIAATPGAYDGQTHTAGDIATELKSPYMRILRRYLGERGLVLEAGCGAGLRVLGLASLGHGHRSVGVDISASVLGRLRSNAQALQLASVSCVRADCEALPFRPIFDLVYNEGVVEHWLDAGERVQAIRRMASVTRPGGHVAVFVPNGRHPLMPIWRRLRYPGYFSAVAVPFHRYGMDGLKEDLAAAGLSVVETDGLSPFCTLNLWPRLPFLFRPLSLLDRTMPLPRSARETFAHNLCCIGRKRM